MASGPGRTRYPDETIPISPDPSELTQPFETPRVLDPMGNAPGFVDPSGNRVGGAGFGGSGVGGGGRASSGSSSGGRGSSSPGTRGPSAKDAARPKAGGASDDAEHQPDEEKCDAKCKKFRRSKSERRKALLRDAKDPKSSLTQEQRDFIIKTDGNNVPIGTEVSHHVPLYSGDTLEDKQALDKADNMTIMNKDAYRRLHVICGDTYHAYQR